MVSVTVKKLIRKKPRDLARAVSSGWILNHTFGLRTEGLLHSFIHSTHFYFLSAFQIKFLMEVLTAALNSCMVPRISADTYIYDPGCYVVLILR